MSVGDDFHGAEAAAERKKGAFESLREWCEERGLEWELCDKCGMTEVRCDCEEEWQAERLRVRTELLAECYIRLHPYFLNNGRSLGERVAAELAKDKETTP